MKYILWALSSSLLIGCSGMQSQNYVESLSTDRPLSSLTHKAYGKYFLNEEPLKSEADYCTNESLQGESITINGILVKEPEKLLRVIYDYNSHKLASIYPQRFKKNFIFENEQVKVQAEKLIKSNHARQSCLKERGWI